MRKLGFVAISAVAVATASASAHDLWMQPVTFWLPAAGSVPVSILVGHGQARENWGIRPDRILLLRSLAPSQRVTDLKPGIRPNSAAPAIAVRISEPGAHMVAMQSNHAQSELPAVRFNEFLKEEGLTPAITHRSRNGATGKPGREIYSRRAKTLIQVGPPNARTNAAATKRLGLELEIVAERDPYMLPALERLPVRVFYEGRPLPGALVKLTNLDADARPTATQLTDGAGRARFAVPRKGKWLLNVVWTKPISGNANADYETTFSSLSFGYPG